MTDYLGLQSEMTSWVYEPITVRKCIGIVHKTKSIIQLVIYQLVISGSFITPLFNLPAAASFDLHTKLNAFPTILKMPCLPSAKIDKCIYITFISQYSMTQCCFCPQNRASVFMKHYVMARIPPLFLYFIPIDYKITIFS